MAFVAKFFGGIIKAIPVLWLKIGTVLVFLFTLGLAAGYMMAVLQITPLILLIPILSMFVMWYKLDEGVLLLLLLSMVVIFFPGILEAGIQALL